MTIPLLDLKREYAALSEEIEDACRDVFSSMHLLNGPQRTAFEKEIAAFTGTKHATGVASGTDALLLAIKGLGIGSGDEVILQANGFIADVEAIRHSGAQPVLVDIEQDGFGPDLRAVERAITPRTKAVLVVHLYGIPLPLDGIRTLCEPQRLAVIEDGSHAHGASRTGQKVGSGGNAGCFSAGVVKNLAAYGDAGFITTDDAELVQRIRLLQTHGQEKKNQHVLYGFNSRLDELQAAVLRVKLRHLEARNNRRRQIATYYRTAFAGLDLIAPVEKPGEVHAYHQFVIRCARRTELQHYLKEQGIDTGIHYPTPLHLQPAWIQSYGPVPALERAESIAREILSIPIFPDLTDTEIEYVAQSVRRFFGKPQ